MKMLNVKVERLPGDKVRVGGEFRDRMKRPAGVSVSLRKGEMAPTGSSLVLEGDSHEVSTTLACLAEVAWGMGWRPPGLSHAIGLLIEGHRFR
jgi:hypothetical protein